MSPRFEIVDARPWHCGMIAHALRRDVVTAMAAIGVDPHRELLQCYHQSSFRKAWMIDGKLGALGGVIGTMASGDGMTWLALSEEATKYPLAIVKEAKRQLDGLLRVKRGLTISLHDGDEASLRLAIFLKFHAIGNGAWEGPAETRAGRRLLAREILGNTDGRILVDNAAMIPMAYNSEAA